MKNSNYQAYIALLFYVALVNPVHATTYPNGIVPECEYFHMTDAYDFIALIWYEGREQGPDQFQIKPDSIVEANGIKTFRVEADMSPLQIKPALIFASAHDPNEIQTYQIDPGMPLFDGGFYMVHLKAERKNDNLYLSMADGHKIEHFSLNMLFENKEDAINQHAHLPPPDEDATMRALWGTESRREVISNYLLISTLASTDVGTVKALNTFSNDVKIKKMTKCILDNRESIDHFKYFNVVIEDEEVLSEWLGRID